MDGTRINLYSGCSTLIKRIRLDLRLYSEQMIVEATEMGILPRHAQVLTTVKNGVIKVRRNNKEELFAVEDV